MQRVSRPFELKATWLLLILSLGCVGCDDSEKTDETPSVVGTWTLESVNGIDVPADVLVFDHPESGETFRIDAGSATFMSDNTWSMSFTTGGEMALFLGTYTLSANTLNIVWTDFPDPDDPYEELVEDGVSLSATLVAGAINFVIRLHGNPHATLRFTEE